MKIELTRINDAVNLEAKNEEGNTLLIDGSADIGGVGMGMKPMQLLLVALGGCSSMDLLTILKKQRQPIKSYKVIIDGERVKEGDVALFRNIKLHFVLVGDLDKNKVEKAVLLSVDKYCSVTKTLEPTATITHSFEIIKE